MTILGGYTLSDHLVLEGLENSSLAAVTVTHTLGGAAIVQWDPMDTATGVELRLVSERHLSLDEVQQVRSLQGQIVQLEHHRGTFNVLVTGAQVEQDDAGIYADPPADTWYSGEIILITV
jgi:hypothetical protein